MNVSERDFKSKIQKINLTLFVEEVTNLKHFAKRNESSLQAFYLDCESKGGFET